MTEAVMDSNSLQHDITVTDAEAPPQASGIKTCFVTSWFSTHIKWRHAVLIVTTFFPPLMWLFLASCL